MIVRLKWRGERDTFTIIIEYHHAEVFRCTMHPQLTVVTIIYYTTERGEHSLAADVQDPPTGWSEKQKAAYFFSSLNYVLY